MALKISISEEELLNLTDRQLKFFMCSHSISPYLDHVLNKMDRCYAQITNKYYHWKIGEGGYFSPFQSSQYAQFLYFLSKIAYLNDDIEIAEKSYYLNKMMNSVDWFYEVELPDIFFADHPLGCVLGRAKYADRFSVSQGCTVGNNHGIYPEIGENVTMHPMAMIVGKCRIGKNVEVAANAFIKDENIPDHSIVFGKSPDLVVVTKNEEEMRKRLTHFRYGDE